MTTTAFELPLRVTFRFSGAFRTFRSWTGSETVDRMYNACVQQLSFLRSRAARKEELRLSLTFVMGQLTELRQRRAWYKKILEISDLTAAQATIYQRTAVSIEGFQKEYRRLYGAYQALMPKPPRWMQIELMYESTNVKRGEEIGWLGPKVA